jgi:hypothetical protein
MEKEGGGINGFKARFKTAANDKTVDDPGIDTSDHIAAIFIARINRIFGKRGG